MPAASVNATRCPRCGSVAEQLGQTTTGHYEFGASAPGILIHMLFFMVVAAGVAPFCYLAGYRSLAAGIALVAAILALVTIVLARRAYRTATRSWYRCTVCGHEWSAPEHR